MARSANSRWRWLAWLALRRTRYDVDGMSYFARAGVTQSGPRRQIDQFFRGLKALGLYSSCLHAAHLGALHNAGQGATVHSMVGLQLTGSFGNGLTWGGADGMPDVWAVWIVSAGRHRRFHGEAGGRKVFCPGQ